MMEGAENTILGEDCICANATSSSVSCESHAALALKGNSNFPVELTRESADAVLSWEEAKALVDADEVVVVEELLGHVRAVVIAGRGGNDNAEALTGLKSDQCALQEPSMKCNSIKCTSSKYFCALAPPKSTS